ncbi:exosome-associated family protein [Botrytis cinerea]
MDPTKILSLLEQLDDDIDDIEDTVAPLIQKTIPEFASKLPLLDKAKLYTLVTYAIESILFSYLRLNGVNAREHPVFTELTRMKQYFEKIKVTENPPQLQQKETSNWTKGPLEDSSKQDCGNDKYDLQRAEQLAKERAKSHIRFEELSKKRKVGEEATDSNKAESKTSDESDGSGSSSGSSNEPAPAAHKSKKSKTAKVAATPVEPTEDSSSNSNSKSKKTKRETQEKKTKSKSKKAKSKSKN